MQKPNPDISFLMKNLIPLLGLLISASATEPKLNEQILSMQATSYNNTTKRGDMTIHDPAAFCSANHCCFIHFSWVLYVRKKKIRYVFLTVYFPVKKKI